MNKDDTALVPTINIDVVLPVRRNLARVSAAARKVARQLSLDCYHKTLTDNTIKRHRGDLAVFSRYLAACGEEIAADDLMYDLTTWNGVNEGLLEGFKDWMIEEGYALGSVSVRLSTVKKYCEVAATAGVVDASDLGLIKSVYGYRGKAGRNVDEKRTTTRVGNKKATPTLITAEQREQLLAQEDSRDALLMYILLRLGFRVGEVASLELSQIDFNNHWIVLYRQKTDIQQTHELRWGGMDLLRAYLDDYQPQGKLFHGEPKMQEDGSISTDYTIRSIQKRVQRLGEQIGLDNFSPHDCRHDFATRMARQKTGIKDMQDALGHKTPIMSLRYVESAKIANEGVVQ